MQKRKQLIPNEIVNIQKFLIAWFISDWFAENYRWILKPKMFWNYEKVFEYLSKFWNNNNPDLFNIISWEDIISLMNSYSIDFLTNRDKYILELFDWYVRESFEWWSDVIKNLDNIKIIRDRLEEIRTGNRNKDYWIVKLLIEAENLSLKMKDKEWILWYKTGLPTLDKYSEW